MNRTLDRRAIEILDQVCDLPEEQIGDQLAELCGTDHQLRDKVKILLAAMNRSGGLLSGLSATAAHSEPTPTNNPGGKFRPGDRIAERYQVMELIGAGGMGEVYLALDQRLDRTVAVKTLNDALLTNSEMQDRFQREMKSVAALSDSNVVTLYDVASQEDTHFAVMEFIRGKTVRQLLQEKVAVELTLQILVGVASGLKAAHEREIMHRDIKPENIVVSAEGEPKILDFGLARSELLNRDQQLTISSATPGTVPYMSPEQAEAKTLDCSTDIFSLGIVIYELLSGSNPFRGPSAFHTMQRICQCTPPSLGAVASQVPGQLAVLVHEMLAREPQNRPSAAEVKLRASRIDFAADQLVPAKVSLDVFSEPQAKPPPQTKKWQPSLIVVPFHVEGQLDSSHPGDAETRGTAREGDTASPDCRTVARHIEDKLTAVLPRVPMLNVVSRMSSMALRGRSLSPSELRRQFRVDYAIEGMVQSTSEWSDGGSSLTAHVQLVDTASGFQIWAQQFEASSTPEMASQLLSKVLARIEPQLVRAILERLRETEEELGSRQLLLQALSALTVKGWNQDAFRDASELLRRSVALEDDFALAHAQLALVRGFGWRVGLVEGSEQAKEEAIRHAERALDLEDMDSNVLGLAGCALTDVGLTQRGTAVLNRAIEQNPNNAQARAALGAAALSEHNFKAAIQDLKQGISLSPLDNRLAIWQAFLAVAQIMDGSPQEALATAIAGCQNDLKSYFPRLALAAAHFQLEDLVAAKQAYQEALRCNPALTHHHVKFLLGRQFAVAFRKLNRS